MKYNEIIILLLIKIYIQHKNAKLLKFIINILNDDQLSLNDLNNSLNAINKSYTQKCNQIIEDLNFIENFDNLFTC